MHSHIVSDALPGSAASMPPAHSPSASAAASAFPTSDHLLSLPDFDLHYQLHGDARSPHKALLIMGLLTDGPAWAFQTEFLKRRGFQCVSYDNRGVAHSGTPGWSKTFRCTTSNMAEDALQLANHLGWQQFHVIGVSMGGMIALELACAAPLRIASLTLVVTHAGGWGGIAPFEGVRKMSKSVLSKDKHASLNTLMDLLYSKATLDDAPLAARLREMHKVRIATRIAPHPSTIAGHTLAVYTHYVSYARLLKLRYAHFQTLVIVGEEDKLVRMSNSAMLAHTLGAKLFTVPNGGHGLMAEYPEVINAEILRFLTQAINAREEEEAKIADHAEDAEHAAAPFALEEHAISLVCSHTRHCFQHNVWGFLTGFLPAFCFRYLFYSSIQEASAAHPVSRWDQSVRFALIVGLVRGAWRAARCILHTYRARQWAWKHKLVHTRATRNNNASQRSGVPAEAIGFPFHSFLFLAACIAVSFQQKLLSGVA